MQKKKKWIEHDIPDLTGKTVIVSGANSGLGYEPARAPALKQITVIMACRNLQKAKIAEKLWKVSDELTGIC